MQPKTDNYPVFEANQVLTNAHLNQSFNYLDEQERLTRANLIGIGIVCGLNVALDDPTSPNSLLLSKGCGVTSEGYLIVETEDLLLTHYRQYTLPGDVAYQPFADKTLWELFPAGIPETTALNSPVGFLNDKAVILFLELKKETLRNCSPNNCDDKGAKVTINVRRLLIGKTHLDAVISAADTLEGMPDAALQLNLPDLRLPRFDVSATAAATSNQVLAAFLKVFTSSKLAKTMENALTQAYQAFKPILLDSYSNNPFSDFAAQFGFLDTTPVSVEQVRFLQYYYDFFDDLMRAYAEFRDQGSELLCACCPPSGLFPRHLMLSLLYPASDSEAGHYRHSFMASAALSDCEKRTQHLIMLFRRLVEMTKRFTLTPLPVITSNTVPDAQIHLTPSKHGDTALSNKAIPYYYLNSGLPPVYQLWNPTLSQRFKANQNLGYRANEYTPDAPAFVTDPLAYDLEPYNFLRIEGHLGKSYQTVVATILDLKARYRLPIDVIALRTGAYESSIPVDLTKENCRFQDLELLYATIRSEILCTLVKVLTYFYNIPNPISSPVKTAVKSQFAVINTYAPDFLVQPNTLGREFEDKITKQNGVISEFDANVMASWINAFKPEDSLVIYSFYFLLPLADELPEDLTLVDFAKVDWRFKNLGIIVKAIETRREVAQSTLDGNIALLRWEEIDDRLEDLQNLCYADSLRTLSSEYASRITELQKKQFFSNFVEKHPGIQHKAGVPIGGTFIVVYHQDPPVANGLKPSSFKPLFIDPMASGALLTAHTESSNLGEIEFPPFVAVTPPVLIGGMLVNSGSTISVRDTTNTTVKTDTAKPLTDKPLTLGEILEVKSTPLIGVSDKITIADNTNTRLQATNRSAIGTTANIGAKQVVTDFSQVTVNQSLLAAIQGLQAQPALITPDIQFVLDGLTTLLPRLPIIPIFPGPVDLPTPADGIIAAAVNGLADSSVIADFFLPYLCCSDCSPIQFVLPKTPPSFTLSIGCSDSSQEVSGADVTVIAKDGTPPYRVKIDDGAWIELDNPYRLSVGEHTVTVQDADNVLSAPQSFSVMEPLRIASATFVCAADAQNYIATATISGGELPYRVNDALINGSQFVSAATTSGTALTLSITDARLCRLETTLAAHTCPPPCNLPDAGQSRRCAFRLWLQAAIDDESFEDYKQMSAIRLRFNDKDISLGSSDDLLQISAADLNSNFRNVLSKTIDQLNKAVNEGINALFGDLGRNRLSISYDPARTDPFGIFWIEYFISDVFSIEFDYGLIHSIASGEFNVRYGNLTDASGANFNGAIFINRNQDNRQTRIPAFACSERNQCDETDYIPLCQDFELIPAFEIQRAGDNVFNFSITSAMPTTDIAAWVWEFTTSTDQPFYEGEKVTVIWNNVGGMIKLTAISDKGCFSTTLSDRR